MPLDVRLLRLGYIRYRQSKVPQEHQHNFYHAMYVLKGRGFVLLNGCLHEISEGHVHIYHPNWSHDVWAKPTNELETLDLRFVAQKPETLERTCSLPPFLSLQSDTQRCLKLMRDIEKEGSVREDQFWSDLAHATLVELLVHAARATSPPVQSAVPSVPMKALALMQKSLPPGISTQHLAERLFVSPSHLTTLFRSCFGKTPQEVMAELKIREIQSLLLLTEKPRIGELGRRYGWNSSQHFRSVFKRVTGTSPRVFMIRHRQYKDYRQTIENWVVFSGEIPMRYRNISPSRETWPARE